MVVGQTEIAELLWDGLKSGSVLSLQPSLELVAALATDLQQDFCPLLNTTLDVLMSGPFCIRYCNVIRGVSSANICL